MTNKVAAPALPANKNLKRSFEIAIRDVYQVSRTGKISEYRTPIVQRARPSSESSLSAEKRALTDAAKALAMLWKIAPSSSR